MPRVKRVQRTYSFTAYYRRDGETEKRVIDGSVKAINDVKAKLEIVNLIRETCPGQKIEVSGFTLAVA